MRMTDAVKQLLIVNIILFVGSIFVPALPDYLALFNMENPSFRPWQVLTHMFMHGSWMHIFFNMFALVSFGSVLEQIWGTKKFVLFYLLCGLGAAALTLGINYLEFQNHYNELISSGMTAAEIETLMTTGKVSAPNVTVASAEIQDSLNGVVQIYRTRMVGASGAIYGLLVAFAFMFPNAELMLLFIPVPVKAKYFVPALLAFDLYLGFNGGSIFGATTGIAHFAHVGGALIGFLLMYFWKKHQFDRNRWDT